VGSRLEDQPLSADPGVRLLQVGGHGLDQQEEGALAVQPDLGIVLPDLDAVVVIDEGVVDRPRPHVGVAGQPHREQPVEVVGQQHHGKVEVHLYDDAGAVAVQVEEVDPLGYLVLYQTARHVPPDHLGGGRGEFVGQDDRRRQPSPPDGDLPEGHGSVPGVQRLALEVGHSPGLVVGTLDPHLFPAARRRLGDGAVPTGEANSPQSPSGAGRLRGLSSP